MGKVTVPKFKRMKGKKKIVMVTAYDYTFAKIIEKSGVVDAVLVGDSLGNVICGYPTTLRVTPEWVAYHTAAVSRGLSTPLLIADMPFMSYATKDRAAKTAELLMRSGAEAVKLEGGEEKAEIVEFLVKNGIPVMGHIGMTPQSVHAIGGYKVRGKTEKMSQKLMRDAIALEQAGAFSIVIETTKTDVAKEITEALKIPTIGIGAGPYTDGQVLVLYDLLGMDPDIHYTFVKRYANLFQEITNALKAYAEEVTSGKFPDEEHSF